MQHGEGGTNGTREVQPADEVHPIVRELTRIFGDPAAAEGSQGFVILPLVSEGEGLAFLRSVPAGTSWEEIPALAAAFRAAHPNPTVPDDEDLV